MQSLRDKSQELRSEVELIRSQSGALRNKSHELINKFLEYDNERLKYLEKTNKLIDQVNLLAKVRKGFLDNINEIYILMNELQDEIYSDDSWLRLLEINKINALHLINH